MSIEDEIIARYTADDRPSIIDVTFELHVSEAIVRRVLREAGVMRPPHQKRRESPASEARRTGTRQGDKGANLPQGSAPRMMRPGARRAWRSKQQ